MGHNVMHARLIPQACAEKGIQGKWTRGLSSGVCSHGISLSLRSRGSEFGSGNQLRASHAIAPVPWGFCGLRLLVQLSESTRIRLGYMVYLTVADEGRSTTTSYTCGQTSHIPITLSLLGCYLLLLYQPSPKYQDFRQSRCRL
jgi:hypothetical protein